MSTNFKQLNPFELKFAITDLLNKINAVSDIQNCLDDFELLDAQQDKKIISKVLFKELTKAEKEKTPVICFLLEHFVSKDELVNKLWDALKNQNLQTEVKITVLNLLRELDADWSYESTNELEDGNELLDANTKQLLNTAIINPEVQIDFLDFLATIRVQDKITLLNSFSEDFTSDALANILIPVFMSEPDSPEGKEALKLLAGTKSVLALHVLEEMKNMATGELLQEIKRSLSTIKIAGMREDRTKEFYKEILSNSKPYKFYLTYPDGHGDVAMIFTRRTQEGKIRFVSIVINVATGIKDCFGFFEISEFECDKILERFLKNEKTVDITPQAFKTILYNAELTTIKNNQNRWKLPYEYVCWKDLLVDIDYETQTIEELLQELILPAKVNKETVYNVAKTGVTNHWFLDYKYSDEFEALLEQLKSASDMDKLVEENIDTVFYPEEKIEWVNKLILSAYIKCVIGKDTQAQDLYGITQDDLVLRELFRQILRRSIYEYLTLVKYNKDADSYGLTYEDIEGKIKYIEDKWVQNV